ncbi:hypothetical protein C1J03_20755 [Sulfitobacter sp. SK012]|uniref:calcium-binding protein n=1 Tax=Sulfitobacter sp. SK012 TaxID=1389005 RepID=UPI000E0A6802|nr:calcium-binding protein [Sulfitobacter sp. SK012]AXI48210.1 hypothetical protein C1J03_20755 [Sulfitobacter sp. SK012]
MATFTETFDNPFNVALGDNILGALGGADPTDTHSADLLANMTYTFMLRYNADDGPLSLEALSARDSFVVTGDLSSTGIQTLELSFTASQTTNYQFLLSSANAATQNYDLRFVEARAPEGTSSDDRLFGTELADTIDLGDGDDYFAGWDGDDNVLGGQGRDRILGGNGDDTIDAGADNDYVVGGAGNDSIKAGQGKDRIDGGDGDDWIWGGSGNNMVNAGSGDDTVLGGRNNDRLFGNSGDDALYGFAGNDIVYGHAGNDNILAADGSDKISGGSGDDTILSGGGDDTIWGGSGADRFIFEDGMDEDMIGDFEDGIDIMDFSRYDDINSLTDLTVIQNGAHTSVAYSVDYHITLRNFDATLIDENDFIFI